MDNFNHTESQPFYNSIQLSESQWQDENKKALALQVTIYHLFLSNPVSEFSGWLIFHILREKTGKKVNLNSIRRAQTNLLSDGMLIKTTKMRMGDENKQEHIYVLNSPENRLKYKDHVYKKGEKTAADLAGEMLSISKNHKPVIIFE